jgi:hypothetical protein
MLLYKVDSYDRTADGNVQLQLQLRQCALRSLLGSIPSGDRSADSVRHFPTEYRPFVS